MQERIGKVLLDYESYPGEDLYSDGEIEDELLDIAKNCREEQLDQVVARKKSWPVLYHFSHVRGNILQWLPMKGDERVLEIGSGCGAITGTLASKAGSVTCIDLSKKRSLVNAYRNSQRDNLQIYVGNFQDIEKRLTEKYDLITLIGVFEYAQGYIDTDNPYVDFLKKIKKHLAAGGRIGVAIENRLGMKYWAGATEDHVGKLFEGIEGYPSTSYAKTFSRSRLNQIIEEAGFGEYEYYYPYPDYKLPMEIYSDRYLPKSGQLNQNIQNFDRARISLFQEERAFDSMVQDELFPLYSNSFLVILKQGWEDSEAKICYSKYSNERDGRFCIRTDICEGPQKRRWVRKASLEETSGCFLKSLIDKRKRLSALFTDTPYHFNKCKEASGEICLEYLKGDSLEVMLDRRLEAGDIQEMKALMSAYFAPMLQHKKLEQFQKTEAFERVFGPAEGLSEMAALPETDIDMIFSNAVASGEGWELIDYEWTFFFPVPVKYVVYRCLLYYIRGNAKRLCLEGEDLYGYFGITEEEQRIFERMESYFQKYILGAHIPIRMLYEEISQGVVYMEPVIRNAFENRRKRRMQVFYNFGDGYGEADSRSFAMEEGTVSVEIPIPSRVKSLRIDPCSESSLLHLKKIQGDGKTLAFTCNGICVGQDLYAFETEDPQLEISQIDPDIRKVYLEFQVEFLKGIALDVVLSQHNTIVNEREKIRQMEGTKAWKLNKQLRRITGRR